MVSVPPIQPYTEEWWAEVIEANREYHSQPGHLCKRGEDCTTQNRRSHE